MVSTPLVSVLMPCYNAASTLDEALAGLAVQTLPDFELIAVDDGSTDGTLSILKAWAQGDRRIQALHQPHGGILQALNSGLAACRSPFVARMDADDRLHPQRLEQQMAYLAEHPEVAVVSCLVEAFPPEQVHQGLRLYLDWLNSLVEPDDIRREMFVESPLVHPSVIVRREWLERTGNYQDHGWPEDYDLWLRLFLAGAQFGKVPQVLLEWREVPQRLTRTDPRYSLDNFMRLKAHYLCRGPLSGCEAVIIWGAGKMGRLLGRELQKLEAPLVAYMDVDPRKVGSTRRGLPVLPPGELPVLRQRYRRLVILAAVGTRGARPILRKRFEGYGLCEGEDWWLAA